MQIKIIDLLNDVLKGNEIPLSVRYKDEVYCYDDGQYDYCHDLHYLFYNCVTSSSGEMMIKLLNDEVEIIEEDKEIDTTELQEKISKLQSEIDLVSNEINHYHSIIHSMRDKNGYMKEALKELQKEVNKLKRSDK